MDHEWIFGTNKGEKKIPFDEEEITNESFFNKNIKKFAIK